MDRPSRPPPVALHDRALDDLRFIRQTMANATAFTAISGLGFLVVGVGAIVTDQVVQSLDGTLPRVGAWVVDAGLSMAIGLMGAAFKARRAGEAVLSGPFRKFALSFAPTIAAGALLTMLLVRHDLPALLPALWLLLYGAGMVAAGAFSVRVVPAMGLAFLALGALAALGPPEWGRWLMLGGFGGLHLIFGAIIARHYGG